MSLLWCRADSWVWCDDEGDEPEPGFNLTRAGSLGSQPRYTMLFTPPALDLPPAASCCNLTHAASMGSQPRYTLLFSKSALCQVWCHVMTLTCVCTCCQVRFIACVQAPPLMLSSAEDEVVSKQISNKWSSLAVVSLCCVLVKLIQSCATHSILFWPSCLVLHPTSTTVSYSG